MAKLFKRIRHDDDYLFKLIRTGETVCGITAKGVVLVDKERLNDFTDDEWLALMRETSKTIAILEKLQARTRAYCVSSQGDIVKLIRLESFKREGNQYAEVELVQAPQWRGKRGETVIWLWQDLKPIIVPALPIPPE